MTQIAFYLGIIALAQTGLFVLSLWRAVCSK